MEDEVYGEAGEKSFRKPSSHFGRRIITVERTLVARRHNRRLRQDSQVGVVERDDWRIKDPDSTRKVGS